MIRVVTAAQDGPAEWLTGIGTLALAVIAVGVALWTEWRAGNRAASERLHSDGVLADERKRHEDELAAERDHSERQLAAEQAFSRSQLEEERGLARQREQLAEAYAVQVEQGETPSGTPTDDTYKEPTDEARTLFALVVNSGSFTITRVEAQFRLRSGGNGSLVTARQTERITGFGKLDERLRREVWSAPDFNPYVSRLAPWDVGISFRTDSIATRYTLGWFPVIRWTDRWGTRWEHRQGEVHVISADELWTA